MNANSCQAFDFISSDSDETASATQGVFKKYCLIDRKTQAQIVSEGKNQSQRELSRQYNLPRTTLQHWMNRKEELKEKMDPHAVEFFESSAGLAWLHRLVLAVFVIFHHNGNSGIPDLHEFFELIEVHMFVGTSISALQKVSKKIGDQITSFSNSEIKRLSQNMRKKIIAGALDENFIMDHMTLILMDPVSGFILAEELEEKRDADTWDKVTQAALKGLNVTINQLVGDEAGGLTKLATSKLRIIKGSDLFHVQQEITKGLTAPLARSLQQAKKKQEELQKEKLERLNKFGDHLKLAGGVNELSKRGVNACIRMLEIEKEEKTTQKEIEKLEKNYQLAQEARREITEAYHPFHLGTGEKQTPEKVKEQLEKSYATLKEIAKESNCTDKQEKKIEKAKGLIGSMIEVLLFFFSFLTMTIKAMGLDAVETALFEKCVSIEYHKLRLQRAKKKKHQRDVIRSTIQKLEQELREHPLWIGFSPEIQIIWQRRALDCAQVFQRSSSCVEGRNGQLSLKFHAFRHVNPKTLRVLTVLHNFFIRRADGSTAAERFFEEKPQDLFNHLLDKIELPRPRKKHKRSSKMDRGKLAA